jgi:hypothetical protein
MWRRKSVSFTGCSDCQRNSTKPNYSLLQNLCNTTDGSIVELLRKQGRSVAPRETHQSEHRVIALFDTTMVLLDAAVEVSIVAMFDLCPQHFLDRTGIRIVPIGGHWRRCLSRDGQSTLKEALCGLPITGGTQQRVHQIPLAVDRAVQVTPLAFYLSIGFIDIPMTADLFLPAMPQWFCEQPCKTSFPFPNGLRSKLETTEQK